MSYESHESRRWQGPVLALVILALSAVSIYFLTRGGGGEPDPGPGTAGASAEPDVHPAPLEPGPKDPILEPAPPEPDPNATATGTVAETPEEILETLGVGVKAADPAALVTQIGQALEAGEVDAAARLIGSRALNVEQLARLRVMAGEARIKLNTERPVSEVGELEINRRTRWALNLDDDYGSRIYLDLQRDLQGRWVVEKVLLPTEVKPGETAQAVEVDDALGITDAFLQAALRQDFETARSFVDRDKVSDAKIAGLCIVFEEGQYHLRPKKPLRASFYRDTTAAFFAYVHAEDGSEVAKFGVMLARTDQESPWRVNEINLDTLLADYAERVAGGDVYFTPLVKNPGGGDTLILYFGFDEELLTPRTERQLGIVSLLLQTDGNKKLHISGHTDALGSENYNQSLSQERAVAVRDFLVESGVDQAQIVTEALGQSKPRRPNQTATGEDDPSGRRVNRRTEIYLDF
jgi:OOP family OmpA-OmpF porin